MGGGTTTLGVATLLTTECTARESTERDAFRRGASTASNPLSS